jgi:glyoxylase-like metal-dependent hydrolase (beta-lactamase superfamily II)
MSLPLEDFFNDVIGKAQRGLRLDDETLAAKAGVSVSDLQAVKSGIVNPAVLAALAGPLNLHAPSLITMANQAWRPAEVNVAGLAQFNTTWDDMTVNAYVVWDPATKAAAAFDTGATAQPMVDFIQANGLTLTTVFLTHTHPDHIADLRGLSAVGAPEVLINEREPFGSATTFAVESTPPWQVGALRIEPRNTHGHSKGGTTYVITGLAQPIAIVGDALFASSMGGGMVSFADALATNRKEIFSLPDNTVVCPGHGPLTSVGEEKAYNPFYPEFK